MEPPLAVKGRILLVDDDVQSAWTLTHLLREDGYAVEVAHDSDEAIARLDCAPTPDILIVDFLLPHADGLTVASHGRTRCATLPVVMISSYLEVVARLDRRLDPPVMMLPKPLHYADLARVLDEIVTPATAP